MLQGDTAPWLEVRAFMVSLAGTPWEKGDTSTVAPCGSRRWASRLHIPWTVLLFSPSSTYLRLVLNSALAPFSGVTLLMPVRLCVLAS